MVRREVPSASSSAALANSTDPSLRHERQPVLQQVKWLKSGGG